MLNDNIKDKIKNFFEKDIFKKIKIKDNLPRIINLTKQYKDNIKNNVIELNFQKKIMNPITLNNKERKSIFNNIYHNKVFKKKIEIKEKILPISLSEKKIFKNNIILKHPKYKIQLSENHSTNSYYLSTHNNENLNIQNINTELKTSRNYIKNILLPNIKIKRNFISSIDNIETEADESFEFYKNKFQRNSDYENKMIKKCNNSFKELEKKKYKFKIMMMNFSMEIILIIKYILMKNLMIFLIELFQIKFNLIKIQL